MGKWIFQITSLTVVLGALIGGVFVLHHFLFQQVRHQDEYLIAITDIELQPPPGYKRRAFLEEVRYLARWPKQFSLLDDALPRRLAKGFAKHPWVESVDDVRISAKREVAVTLTYRRPVLAVRYGNIWRAVDRHGVLLPRNAGVANLPKFDGDANPPTGPAGSKWGDTAVEEAAADAAAKRG